MFEEQQGQERLEQSERGPEGLVRRAELTGDQVISGLGGRY